MDKTKTQQEKIMKIGIDLQSERVYIEITDERGTTTASVRPNVARAIADQLNACADSLNHATANGYLEFGLGESEQHDQS